MENTYQTAIAVDIFVESKVELKKKPEKAIGTEKLREHVS